MKQKLDQLVVLPQTRLLHGNKVDIYTVYARGIVTIAALNVPDHVWIMLLGMWALGFRSHEKLSSSNTVPRRGTILGLLAVSRTMLVILGLRFFFHCGEDVGIGFLSCNPACAWWVGTNVSEGHIASIFRALLHRIVRHSYVWVLDSLF